MTQLLLAIDAGTTGVTAITVDGSGVVRGRGYQTFPQSFPSPGRVEHDLDDIWAATLAAGTEAIGADTASVVAVGVTNQRETACLWNRTTFAQVRPAIVWQDRRSADVCDRLAAAGVEAEIRELTGLRLDPYFTATKLRWVKDHEPDTWRGVETGETAVGTVDSYLVARMTAGVRHITDATNASRTLLYDITTGTWSPRLREIFEMPAHCLPEIVASWGLLAHCDPTAFLGLDVPIAGIAGDQQAALVGQCAVSSGRAKCTYGTGSFLLVNTGTQIRRSDHGLLTTVAFQAPDGERSFALEGSVFTTGSALQWLRDGLSLVDDVAEIEPLARSVPDSGGLVFVPALTGLGAPDWDPYAGGLLVGISRGTTRAHIALAALEAVAVGVKDVVDLLAHEAGVVLESLRVDGGGAVNDLLCELQADATGVTIDRPVELQSTALGAAFLAGLGAGVWTSWEEVAATRHRDALFEPTGALRTDHRAWRCAVERSLGWFSPLAELD